jgi:hypothetical protein
MTKPSQVVKTQMGLVDEPGPIEKKFAGRLSVDRSKVRECIDRTLSAYRERKGLFSFVHHLTNGPQHIYVPDGMEKGSLEHFRYFFFVTPTDHMQDSRTLYSNHMSLYADQPWLYSEKVLELGKEKLAETFQKYKIGLHNENARFWVNNAQTLQEFGGDPVRIFKHCGSTIEGVLAWREEYRKEHKRNPLLCFEHKIASLYMLYLAEFGGLRFPKDAFAVDVHVMFQMLQVGAVVLHERMGNTQVARVIRELICDECAYRPYEDKIDLANALWLRGNEGCSGCSKNKAAPILCSIYEMCQGRFATDNYHHNGTIDPQDPIFPKGGQLKFGIQRFTRRRPEKKGRGSIIVERRETLFDEQFEEEEVAEQKRNRKVIPITVAKNPH